MPYSARRSSKYALDWTNHPGMHGPGTALLLGSLAEANGGFMASHAELESFLRMAFLARNRDSRQADGIARIDPPSTLTT